MSTSAPEEMREIPIEFEGTNGSNLEWKCIDINSEQVKGFENGCMFELEELNGDEYKIVTDENGGRTLDRSGINNSSNTKKARSSKKKKEPKKKTVKVIPEDMEKLEPYPEWQNFKLDMRIHRALRDLNFSKPTPIQSQTIHPSLVQNRDVVGIAETGSGKTLAFGIPLVQQLLDLQKTSDTSKEPGCLSLILTPTRELAMQVCKHLKDLAKFTTLRIVPLVGGMSTQKQERQLSYNPEIVIATPGRLWELVNSGHVHFEYLAETLRFLIIDEADRLVDTGKYEEVEKLFELLTKPRKIKPKKQTEKVEEETQDEEDDEAFNQQPNLVMLSDEILNGLEEQRKEPAPEPLSDNEEEDMESKIKPTIVPETVREAEEEVVILEEEKRLPRQTFLFSATLSLGADGRFSKKKKPRNRQSVLEAVMKRVGLRGKPALVDLTTRSTTRQENTNTNLLPEGLELCQIECLDKDRNSYLYYFCTQYPGRTIVFLNSIQQVRRVIATMTLLKLPVFGLHAEMQQRQRLKKLDAFRKSPKGILIATDVAARGLDIPDVQYVVHYHIPRSTEIFIHRSGRTARAAQTGLALSLVAPPDMKYHQQICKVLKVSSLDGFPVDHRYLPEIKERVNCADEIFKLENKEGKKSAENSWFIQMAKDADMALDDDLIKTDGDHDEKRNAKSHVDKKRHMLKQLLSRELRPIGSTRKFRAIHQEIDSKLTSTGDFKKRNAQTDLSEKKSKKRHKRRR